MLYVGLDISQDNSGYPTMERLFTPEFSTSKGLSVLVLHFYIFSKTIFTAIVMDYVIFLLWTSA